jgi:hypothetical protein
MVPSAWQVHASCTRHTREGRIRLSKHKKKKLLYLGVCVLCRRDPRDAPGRDRDRNRGDWLKAEGYDVPGAAVVEGRSPPS